VNGNLNIRKLSVELGSTFNGNCKMISEADFDRVAGAKEQKAQPAAAPAN
jgi:cytoskeletal protein CcmA (bactofilin family)